MHMCVFVNMSAYTRVFTELVLTQTQSLHCPSPSVVRMFEGHLIAWLPLISAGTQNPGAGRLWPSKMLSASEEERHKTGSVAGKVTVENYGTVNYRFLKPLAVK